MTSTTYPAGTADLFAGEYAGVRLMEDEFGRIIAHGHITAAELEAGIVAYCVEVGADAHGMTCAPLPIEHVWAVLQHEDADRDDEGWSFSWRDVTERTPHAFPLTVVPR